MLSWQGYAQNDSLQLSPAIQNLALKNLPSSFVEEYTYDPTLNLYIYTVKVGEIDINAPLTLTPEEYLDRMMRQEALDYMNDKQALLSGDVEDPEQQKIFCLISMSDLIYFDDCLGVMSFKLSQKGQLESIWECAIKSRVTPLFPHGTKVALDLISISVLA